jgi:hypothetical protein
MLPPRFSPPSKPVMYELPSIPAPSGPSASAPATPHATTTPQPHTGSLATDWQSTNDIRRQQLQTTHGLSADDAHDITDIPYSEPDDSDFHG